MQSQRVKVRVMSNQITRLEYCQYLLVTQINYTLTNFADHSSKFSHDKINRFLKGEKITPRSIWDNQELAGGKTIKIKDWTKEHKVKLFRVEVSSQGHALSGDPTSVRCPHCTDYVVTNDLTQNSTLGDR